MERGRYESRQAERRYRAVDPENRLVASTLEQQWEQVLRQVRQLEEEYDRFLQQAPPVLSVAERERIQALASDIPALWHSSTTTAADRKAIIRCLIDRVTLNVENNSEDVGMAIHWVGGFVSQHQVRRAVREYEQLRDFDRLVGRIRELQNAGSSAAQIAEQLNQEGFHPARQCSKFSKPVIRQLVSRLGLGAETPKTIVLGPDEWWTSSLAKKLQLPVGTLQQWVVRGWVRYRRSSVRGFRILWADASEIKRLKQLRTYVEAHHRGPPAKPGDAS